MPFVNYLRFYYKQVNVQFQRWNRESLSFSFVTSRSIWSSSNLYSSHNADWTMWLMQSMKGPAGKLISVYQARKAICKNHLSKNKKLNPTIVLNDQCWAFASPITTSYCLCTVTVCWCSRCSPVHKIETNILN